MTLNGLAAGPDDSVDFVPAATRGDRSFGQEQLALMDAVDTILLGRTTYQMFSGYWPQVSDPQKKPFADKLNAIPKICPVVLESGRHLFRDKGPAIDMKLLNARTMDLGAVVLKYASQNGH